MNTKRNGNKYQRREGVEMNTKRNGNKYQRRSGNEYKEGVEMNTNKEWKWIQIRGGNKYQRRSGNEYKEGVEMNTKKCGNEYEEEWKWIQRGVEECNLLDSLEKQTRVPDQVVISCSSVKSVKKI